jgi:hypothetical protein
MSAPKSVFIVKIDSWFGPRWLSFSCKVMGAFGVSYLDDLVIPPFVPRRVMSQRSYERAGDHLVEVHGATPLHIRQSSEANLRRRLKGRHPHAALFWWSGNTRSTGRGALMVYCLRLTGTPTGMPSSAAKGIGNLAGSWASAPRNCVPCRGRQPLGPRRPNLRLRCRLAKVAAPIPTGRAPSLRHAGCLASTSSSARAPGSTSTVGLTASDRVVSFPMASSGL